MYYTRKAVWKRCYLHLFLGRNLHCGVLVHPIPILCFYSLKQVPIYEENAVLLYIVLTTRNFSQLQIGMEVSG